MTIRHFEMLASRLAAAVEDHDHTAAIICNLRLVVAKRNSLLMDAGKSDVSGQLSKPVGVTANLLGRFPVG